MSCVAASAAKSALVGTIEVGAQRANDYGCATVKVYVTGPVSFPGSYTCTQSVPGVAFPVSWGVDPA